MLNLNEENKDLCFADSTLKDLYLFIYYWQNNEEEINGGHWQYFTTIENAIVLESASRTEGFLESETFELGSYVLPSMTVEWQNDGTRYENMVCVPVQKIGTQYIAYFDGYIAKEEISGNGETVKAEIQSFIYERLNIEVSQTLMAYSGNNFADIITTTLGLSANIFCDEQKLYSRFPNAVWAIDFTEEMLKEKITVENLLKQAGEFLGANVVVKDKRVVDLKQMTEYTPYATPTIEFVRISSLDTVAKEWVDPLPEEYSRVEYLQSTGVEFIDTGYIGSSNTRIEIKQAFIISQLNNPDRYAAIGNAGNGKNRIEIAYDTRIKKFTCNWGTTISADLTEQVFVVGGDSLPHIFEYRGDGYFAVDNVYSGTHGTPTFTCDTSLYLFQDRGREDFWCPIKTYYCKIWDGDNMVRNFIPCVRKADGVSGMYDLINGVFYTNGGYGKFICPEPISSYKLPYYINLYYDKTDKLGYEYIYLKTSDDKEYSHKISTVLPQNSLERTYEISGNVFFDALSASFEDIARNALEDVGLYIADISLYNSTLHCVYPMFIEPTDYLVCEVYKPLDLPQGYHRLEYIDFDYHSFSNINSIDTGIVPNSSNIEIYTEFEILNKAIAEDTETFSAIFTSDGNPNGDDVLNLSIYNGELSLLFGGATPDYQVRVSKPYVPKNQKIIFDLKISDGYFSYSGTFNSNEEQYNGSVINTNTTLKLGDDHLGSHRFYRFSYTQDNIKLCDYYPCIETATGEVGLYDIIGQKFQTILSTPFANYGTAEVIIPATSIEASGIHSILADIQCSATNTKSK